MAVYTHINEQQLADFLSQYAVGTAESFKGIAEGVENSNYLLQTSGGAAGRQFILTLYEKRVDAADLPYYLGLMQHLADRGLPAPRPIAGVDGKALRTLAGRPAAMIEFLKGVSVEDPSPAHCQAAGAAIARAHLAWSDVVETRANPLSVVGWRSLAEKTLPRADTLKPGLEATIHQALKGLSSAWPDGLPAGPIHADLFPDNVLFTGHDVTGLIDFYFACTDMLAYDLAVMINAWGFDADHQFDPQRSQALINGYASVRPLEAAEWQALPTLCRGAALRFLLTRLYDWLNPVPGAVVRPKDPLDYEKRLRFHGGVADGLTYAGGGQ